MSTQGRLVRDENGIVLGSYFYVRVPRSSRKLDKVISAFGGCKPQFYFSFHFSGNFLYVNAEEYYRIRQYVTRARVDTGKLLKCWS